MASIKEKFINLVKKTPGMRDIYDLAYYAELEKQKRKRETKEEKQKRLGRTAAKLEEQAMPIKATARGIWKQLGFAPKSLQAETKEEKEKYQKYETAGELGGFMALASPAFKLGSSAVKGIAKVSPKIAKKLFTKEAGKVVPRLSGRMAEQAIGGGLLAALKKPEEGKKRGIEAGKEAASFAAFPFMGAGLKMVGKPIAKAISKKAAKPIAKKIAAKTPKIHPEDQKVMTDFIDYVRLKKPENKALELDASRLAEHYGLKMPKTRAGLANEFDRVLTGIREKPAMPVKQPTTVEKAISKELEPLTKEARKYKSAEDFKKALKKGIIQKYEELPPNIQKAKRNLDYARKVGSTQDIFKAEGELATEINKTNTLLSKKELLPTYSIKGGKDVVLTAIDIESLKGGIYEPVILGKKLSKIKKSEVDGMIKELEKIVAKKPISRMKGEVSPNTALQQIQMLKEIKNPLSIADFYNQAVKGIKEAMPGVKTIPKEKAAYGVGAVAGIEYNEETGKWEYNPAKAALGMALGVGAAKVAKEIVPKLIPEKNIEKASLKALERSRKEVIKSEAEFLRQLEKNLKTVKIRSEEEGRIVSIASEHNTAFREFYKKYKKRPNKQEWLEIAESELSKGRSGLGLGEYYKRITEQIERKAPEAEIDVKELFKEMPEKIAPEVQPKMPPEAPTIAPEAPKIAEEGVIPPPLQKLGITPLRMQEIKRIGAEPKEYAERLFEQKRGIIPHKLGEEMAGEVKPMGIDKIINLKPGSIKNIEQVNSIQQELNVFEKRVKELEKVKEQSPEALKQWQTENAKLAKASLNLAAIRSEAARVLEGSKFRTERDKVFDAFNKIRSKLNEEEKVLFDEAISKINTQKPKEVQELLVKFQKPKFGEKVAEYYKAMLLSAPITHVRNTVGNTLYQIFDIPVRGLAGTMAKTKSIFTGKPQEVFAGEAIRMIYSGLKSIPDAVTQAMKALRDESFKYGGTTMAFEHGIPKIKGVKGKIVRLPFRALNALDVFARTTKNASEIDSLAYRLAKQEGKSGENLITRIEEIKRNPPAKLLETVKKKVDRAIFVEEMSGILKTLEEMKNKHPLMQFIIPFYRTPVNLFREATRLTPLGVMGKPFKESATRMEETARMTLGSLAGLTFMWRMLDGSIDVTGAVPKTEGERDLFYRQGKQPYSIRIGDNWYSYQQIQPFSSTLFGFSQLGEMIKVFKERGELDGDELLKQADRIITDLSQFIQDQTFFRGLANMMEVMSGGKFSQGTLESGENWFTQLAGGLIVPNIFYSYKRAADPKIYKSEGLVQELQKRVPGMGEDLLYKRNVFGEPSERAGTFLTRFLSPIQVSQVKEDPVDQELERIGITIGYPGEKAFGEGLTNEEYDKLLEVSGKMTKDILGEIINDPEYQALPDYDKEKLITKVQDKVRDSVREKLFPEKKLYSDLVKELLKRGYSEDEAAKNAKMIIENETKEGRIGTISY